MPQLLQSLPQGLQQNQIYSLQIEKSLLNNESVTAETNDKRQKKMDLSFLSSQVLKKGQYEITYQEVA